MTLTKHIKFLSMTTALVGAMAFTATQADAAGFFIQEQSVSGLGTAFSGSTTSINDASTIFYNPAGMTELDGAQINVGANLLIPYSELTDEATTVPTGAVGGDGGNPYNPSLVPNLYFATPANLFGHDFWAGFGVSAPFGLSNEYDQGYFARYDSTESHLTTLNFTPAIAYKVNDQISIGGGLDIQYVDADLRSAVFPGAGTEGVSMLQGDDWTTGYNLGVKIKPTEKLDFGIHYRSGIDHKVEGVSIVQGTTVGDSITAATAELNLPDIATFGVGYDYADDLRLTAQATWFGWSNYERIRVVNANSGNVLQNQAQGYENVWAFSIGAEHDLNEEWTVRAGYQFDETPTQDNFRSTRTPDGNRHWFTVGATHYLDKTWSVDMSVAYIDVADEEIDLTRNPLSTSTIDGKSEGHVGIIAAGVNYKF